MNDLTKSYYEIANEEHAKAKTASNPEKAGMTDQEQVQNQPPAYREIMEELVSNGLEFGSEDFWAAFDGLIEGNSQMIDQEKQKRMPPENDDEMMEQEQLEQATMMKRN